MAFHCVRCGIDVSEEGLACRDCRSVAPKYVSELRKQADARLKARREKENLIRGMTLVGTTAHVRNKTRKRSR